MVKALLLENIHSLGSDLLRSAGIEVDTRSGALDEDELIDALAGVQVLGLRSKTQLTARVIENAPDLLAAGAFCIGTNQIDLAAAANAGVATFNAPFSNTRSVVELALAEIIALTRRLTEKDKSLHAGVWDKSANGAHEVRGRTLGIVGYGNIGTQLSVVAEALGMRVVFFDTAEKLALGNAKRMPSLNALLEESDVVTLHVDGREGNAGMFGARQFARMKEGAIFLNLSRGFLVDYDGLREEILAGRLAGAAVDVFGQEPKSQGDPFDSELRDLPNVILTPHVGGSTEEAQQDIGRFVAAKLRDYLENGATALSVNLPSLILDRPSDGAHRVAHLHHNVPGVLAHVNQALSDAGVNIESQVLSTSGSLGYVVTDIAGDLPRETLQQIEQMDATIRVRALSPDSGD
ncbi:phosphoglycerate dehydrogenase [Ruania halotolerans]|uniref:phosphoglycerate dehydrogenase n=1 Tax=Ruania halotolerans TaxID=2897773 RepID=UPI001E487B9C|nr:phosphoglycerate dehydrogenase [Ruania halotolerans]UFU05141.1 phosphoglycerate dehydrogenase [Ruania halotolerans]